MLFGLIELSVVVDDVGVYIVMMRPPLARKCFCSQTPPEKIKPKDSISSSFILIVFAQKNHLLFPTVKISYQHDFFIYSIKVSMSSGH